MNIDSFNGALKNMIVYTAGPYREYTDYNGKKHSTEENIEVAKNVAVELWQKGHFAVCPHMNTAGFEDICDIPQEEYIKRDLDILAVCDAIVLLPGWEYSKGTATELAFAEKNELFIYYYPDVPELHYTEVNNPNQCIAFRKYIGRMYRVHLKKNEDYSAANIAGTGMIGVVVRAWDKMARLMNLTGFKIKVSESEFIQPKNPKNESIEDTLIDFSNYGAIGHIYREGKWGN